MPGQDKLITADEKDVDEILSPGFRRTHGIFSFFIIIIVMFFFFACTCTDDLNVTRNLSIASRVCGWHVFPNSMLARYDGS